MAKSSKTITTELRLPPELLVYQRQILEQMQLCQNLMVGASESHASVQMALIDWYLTLAAATSGSARSRAYSINDIPDEPDPGKRAMAFFPIVSAIVNDLDPPHQDNTKRFLIHVAWHEGKRLTTRLQIKGPAKSFFQFEAYRAKGAIARAQTNGVLAKVVAASGKTAAEIAANAGALPDYDPNDSACSVFPAGNLIGSLLETNDQFGSYLARIDFTRFAAPIGNTNGSHADYWYQYWKGSSGNEASLKARFIQEANEVDVLIVPLIKQFNFRINNYNMHLQRSGAKWLQLQDTTLTNTYFDRGHDTTWVFMDDGPKGVVEIRVPISGGDAVERYYRRGAWTSYGKNLVAEYS